METALVFNKQGDDLYWHFPADRTPVHLPDSKTLWDVLWAHRDNLGGVAHTHPWKGTPEPSVMDLTTFAAIEAGLGQRLVWPIATLTSVIYFEWIGPDRLEYGEMGLRRFRIHKENIERLRNLSR